MRKFILAEEIGGSFRSSPEPNVMKSVSEFSDVVKHPGHGDQKVHGRRGGSSLPEGWSKKSDEETIEYWATVARDDWSVTDPAKARQCGVNRAEISEFYSGPNGSMVQVQRGHGVTEADLAPTLERVNELQKIHPVPNQYIEVSTDAWSRFPEADPAWGGFAHPGKPFIYLKPSTVKDGLRPEMLMPSAKANKRAYAVTHEWGHTVDRRDKVRAAVDHATKALPMADQVVGGRTALSVYGRTDKRESYAEAFAEWSFTGQTTNPVVAYFHGTYNWGLEGSVEKALAAKSVTLIGDTFGEGGPGETESIDLGPFPELREEIRARYRKAAVVKFAPGLTPVLKHPGHGDQKIHGRRGGSTTTNTENPHIPAELKSAFEYTTGPFDDGGESLRSLTKLREKAEEHAIALGYSLDDAPHGGRMSSADIYTDGIHSMAIDKRNQNARWKKRTEGEEELADLKTVHDAVDKWRTEGDVMMKVPSEHLDSILAVGVKNQFDTGESGGLLDNDLRAVNEFAAHGVLPNAKGADRPVYGFIGQPGREHPGSLMDYGDVTLVLKDNARDRTTVTLGDSLNTFSTPVPLKGRLTDRQVSDMTAVSPFSRDSNDYEMVASQGVAALSSGKIFMEAQISGGVSRSDISRIVFARRFHSASKVASLRASLADEGIEVEVAP